MSNSNRIMNDLTSIISDHLVVSQSTQIQTQSLQATYVKDYAARFVSSFSLHDCEINIPDLCDLAAIGNDCSQTILMQQVSDGKNPFFSNLFLTLNK
jgi:hypothetical protein